MLCSDTVSVLQVKVGNIAFLVGFVRYETNFWENPTFRYGVIGGICGLLFLILFLICVCCLCKRQRRLQEMKQRRAAKIMENSFDEFSLEPSDKTLTRHRNVYTNGVDNKGSFSDMNSFLLTFFPFLDPLFVSLLQAL